MRSTICSPTAVATEHVSEQQQRKNCAKEYWGRGNEASHRAPTRAKGGGSVGKRRRVVLPAQHRSICHAAQRPSQRLPGDSTGVRPKTTPPEVYFDPLGPPGVLAPSPKLG